MKKSGQNIVIGDRFQVATPGREFQTAPTRLGPDPITFCSRLGLFCSRLQALKMHSCYRFMRIKTAYLFHSPITLFLVASVAGLLIKSMEKVVYINRAI